MDTQRLRFKGINGVEFPEWKKTSIEDLFDVSAGGDLDKDHFSHFKDDKHVYPIYANALTNGGLFGYSTKYTVAEKSITVTGRGEVGHATARDGKYTPIVRLLVCKPKNNQNTKFFEEAINRTNIVIESTGVPQLTVPQLKRIILPVPSLPEQQKIADFLSSYDEKISIQRERVEALERRKKGLLQKVFSQELRFKADDGSEYPEWKEELLNELSEYITVGIANSATQAYRKDGVAMFRNQNIHENYLDDSDVLHIEESFEKKYWKKRLKTNDILVTRTGNPGIACLVPQKYEGAQTFTTLIVRLHTEGLVPAYICQFINSKEGKKYISSTQIGGGQKNSGAAILEKMPIKIPCYQEQQKIAAFFTVIDDQINIEKERLTTMETIKKGLLQGIFC